jgi:hypothetical protein
MGQKTHRLVEDAICRTVEQSARASQLSVPLLTRLLWTESRFQVAVISPAGAQGIAQFMPDTADERGLSDPFNPEQATPQAARLLVDLDRKFGNIGLAVAAYNAGPGRVASWLGSGRSLPRETERFVLAITGRSADEWVRSAQYIRAQLRPSSESCMELRTILRDFRFDDDAGYRSTLPGLEQSGRMLPSLAQSGRMLPGMEQSGRLLPSLAQSGRMLPGLEQSGRLLPSLAQSGRVQLDPQRTGRAIPTARRRMANN